MDIVYNLKKFFNEQQDEAAIPGLGVFYSSTIDENGNELPEGESVILFIEKTPRSNAFVNFLGYEENLTESEALDILEKWVSSILNSLKTKRVAIIPALGSFEIKQDKVVFVPSADQYPKYLSDYGLDDELPADSKKRDKRESSLSDNLPKPKPRTEAGKPTNKSTLVGLIIAAVLVVLIGSGIACYKIIPGFTNFVDQCTNDFSNGYAAASKKKKPAKIIIPSKEIETAIIIENEDLFAEEKTVKEEPKPEVVAQPKPVKAPVHKDFKVIGGAFSIKANAEKFHKQMKNKGYASELFFENKKQLYYVTLGSFECMSQALDYKERIRKTQNIRCWVYKK